MREAIEKGSLWLSEGMDALDVVEKVINILEGGILLKDIVNRIVFLY